MLKQTQKLALTAKINLAIAIIAIFSVGALTGYLLGYFRVQEKAFPAIKAVADVNEGVAMVQLMEIKAGQLIGRVGSKKVRLIHHPSGILELQDNAVFSIPVSEINLNNFFVQNQIPENTLYIASKQGKLYYSVFDSRAFLIDAKNRVFFKTSSEAESAGYKRKE